MSKSSPIQLSSDSSDGEDDCSSVKAAAVTVSRQSPIGQSLIAYPQKLDTMSDSSESEVENLSSDPSVITIPDSPVKLVVCSQYRDTFQCLDAETPPKPKAKKELFGTRDADSTSLHNKNELHPLAFETPPPKYSAEYILKLLLDPNIDQSRVCRVWPVSGVKSNATFVVDITSLKHPDDVRKDFFGKWIHSGSHPFTFKATIEKDGDVFVQKCAPGASRNVFYLRRLHCYHPSNTDFRRMLAFVSDESYNPHPLCLVVYYIPSGFSPVVVSHGNSKTAQPYFPTLPSTTMDIKKKCISTGPKEVVSNIENSAGGILDATYPGQLPRNEQQISNFKRQTPVSSGQKLSCQAKSNELYSIMLQAHLEEGSEKFIRDVKAYPEPAIVLASDQQVLDLERFCCDSSHYSILTVDPTFSLGDFDVTPTTYRHLLLCSKRTSKPPVMLGPTMIHYRKNFSTYKFLASCMTAQNRNLVGLRVFGTDGERPLIDAFLHEFKFAVHLTCFNHVRRNIKDKLHGLKIPDDVQTEILNDIFGRKVGSTQLTGLVDSVNRYSFEENLSTLISKWKLNDMNDDGPVSLFCSWFRTNKEEVIRDTMLLPVREEAGLGSPPEPFYTNSSECINNVLKIKVDYKRTELTLFVNKLHQLVQDQQREVEKAVLGCGKYYLQSQYSELAVDQSKWFTMNKEQRKRWLKKLNEMPVTAIDHGPSISHLVETTDIVSSADDSPKLPSTADTSAKANVQPCSQSVSQPPQATVLSTKLSSLSSKLGLPTSAIDGIAKKAAEILSTDGAIVQAPGHSTEAKMVISRSGKRPHLVLPKRKSGGLTCDEDCPQYKSAKLCSHTVAAAEYNKQLDQFIASYNSVKKIPNLTKLATTDVPKGRGRKGSKGPVKRKPSLPIEKRIELNPPASESAIGMEVQISPSISTVYQPSLSAPVNVTIGGSPSLPGVYSPCISTSFPTVPPTAAFGPSASPYPPPCPPVFSTPYLSPPYMHPLPTPPSPYCGLDPTNGGAYPFRVHLITGNISVCHGCKGKYNKKLGPPNNICLQHEEWRTFTPPGSSEKQSRFGNVYYHCNVSCVMAVWPTFIPSSVVVPMEVQSKLLPEHKHLIYVTFGVPVM